MGAPATTARGTPTGYKLPDGYRTTIAFSLAAAAQLWEKQVKPPGVDGGNAIDTTTMLNDNWRTMSPRSLKTLSPITFKAAYDPDVFPTLVNTLINAKTGSITIHFPEASTLDFFGYLEKAEFDDMEEGKMPEGTFTITPTNYDPVGKVEAAPVFTAASGT